MIRFQGFCQIIRLRRMASLVVLLGATVARTSPAEAGIPWHPEIAQARAASLISHRPVLIIFTAQWSDASMKLEETSLASDEAMALVTACFEPVRIDVDADPETTRKMGVSFLPTACVVDTDDRVLAKFDCPDSSPGFVAAAGRAAQDAAAIRATASAPNAASTAGVNPPKKQPDLAKPSQPIAPPAPSAVAATEPPVSATATLEEATLPAAPPIWPAEQSVKSVTAAKPVPATSALQPARPAIEPAASPKTNGVASWLNPTAAASETVNAPAANTTTGVAGAEAATAPPPSPIAKPGIKETATSFLKTLQKPLSIFSRQPNAAPTAAPATAPAQPSLAKLEPDPTLKTAAADAFGSMPVGLEGYCPVTLVDKGTWVEGRAQWGVRHRGRTYLFAGDQAQKVFLSDPDRYAPALSGDDPVLAIDSGKAVPGQRRYGVTYQSRMYLFSSPESRSTFATNPQRFTARVLLAEQSSGTADAVRR